MDHEQERRAAFVMLLRSHGVRETRVLSAFERVPRALFVNEALAKEASRNSPLPLPCGQTMERPSMAARMVEALQVERGHRVLEIGAGSGWLTAILAELAADVTSLERYAELAAEAAEHVGRLGVKHAHILHADGFEGAPDATPFDRILVNGAIQNVPKALISQLNDEGIIVAPVGDEKGKQQLTRFTKNGGKLSEAILWPVKTGALVPGRARYL